MRPLAAAAALMLAAPTAVHADPVLLLMMDSQERERALDFLSGAVPRAAAAIEGVRRRGVAADDAIVVPRHIAREIAASPAPLAACADRGAGSLEVAHSNVDLDEGRPEQQGLRHGSATVELRRAGCGTAAAVALRFDLLNAYNGRYRMVLTEYQARPVPALSR